MPNAATTVPLPLPGPADVKRWMTEVNTARGPGYASAVSISLAHYRLQGQADARRELAKVFPNAHERMSVVTLPFIRKIAEETARVFGGEGETFDLLDPRSGDPIDGWPQVVEDTNLRAKLKIINRLTRVARRTFGRVTWDATQERVRITTWTPDAIWPRFAPDSYDLDSCHGVLLRLSDVIDAKGKPCRRWEFWSPTQNFIINELGETWVAEESGGENPYRYDDGTPVVPIVAFGDEDDDAGYWLSPRQDWIDSQRALNVGESSRMHLSNVAGYGQWVAEHDPAATSTADWEEEVETGPDGLVKVPRGWTLQNKFAQADFKGLGDEGERHLRVATSLNGLPPGSVIGDARQVPSGAALLLERQPLDELRTDQIANYREPVQRLLELVRIVHNHHCRPGAEMIGVPRWVPGSVGLPPDPESQRRIREADVRLGVASPVTILMEDRGVPRAEAEKMAAECAADNARRNTMTALGARLMAGGAVAAPVAGAPVVADEPEATVDDGTGPILGPDGEPMTASRDELDGGILTINELRRAKGLRPDSRFGDMTLPEYKAANREMYAAATTTGTGGSAEKFTGLAEPVKA